MCISSWLSPLVNLPASLSGPPLRRRLRSLKTAFKPDRRRNRRELRFAAELLEDRALLTAPMASDDSFSALHDQLIMASPGVLMNDYDMDGDPITPTLLTNPTHGSLTFNSDGSFLYTPNSGYVGGDSFTYNVSGGGETSNTATVSLSLSNSVPTTSDDSFSTLHDQPITASAGVLANDYDMDGDSITPTLLTNPANGTLTFNSDGTFTYTPNAGYVGSDSFTYNVSDGLSSSNTGTVTLSMSNNAPSAADDSYSTPHDQPITASPGVLTNDYDMDGDAITLSLEDDVSNGTLTLNADGSFTYTPNTLFVGTDSFTYKVSDGIEDSDIITVTIDVTNAVPFAADDDFDYPEPGVQYIDIDVLANDWDMDDDHADLVITSVSTPTFGGTASIVGNKIRFFPPTAYSVNDVDELDVFSLGTEFTYTVADPVALADATQPVGQGTVRANPKKWALWREYSRGNDDANERIYETGIVRVELGINDFTKKVSLNYTATATTGSRLRWAPPGAPFPIQLVQPGDANQGVPEYEFYQSFLFLQKSAGSPGTAVPAGAEGVNLGFAGGGAGGALSGQIELDTWTNANINGTAVVQMRLPYRNGAIVFGPPVAGDTFVYAQVRQNITWTVDVELRNGQYESSEATLRAREVQYVPGTVATPLRFIDSSMGEHNVWKIGYPAKPGGARKDFVPDVPGNPATYGAQDDPGTPGDQRGEFIIDPTDWNLKVKAKTK